jgi:hypothetical protein
VTTAHDVREGKIAWTQFIHNTRTKFDAVQTAESSISTTDVHDDVTVANWIFQQEVWEQLFSPELSKNHLQSQLAHEQKNS